MTPPSPQGETRRLIAVSCGIQVGPRVQRSHLSLEDLRNARVALLPRLALHPRVQQRERYTYRDKRRRHGGREASRGPGSGMVWSSPPSFFISAAIPGSGPLSSTSPHDPTHTCAPRPESPDRPATKEYTDHLDKTSTQPWRGPGRASASPNQLPVCDAYYSLLYICVWAVRAPSHHPWAALSPSPSRMPTSLRMSLHS